MDNRCLRPDPNPEGRGTRLDGGTHVRVGRSEPGGALSLSAEGAGTGPAHGVAGCHPADRAGVSQLRLAPDHGRTQATWLESESHVVIASKDLESVARTNRWPTGRRERSDGTICWFGCISEGDRDLRDRWEWQTGLGGCVFVHARSDGRGVTSEGSVGRQDRDGDGAAGGVALARASACGFAYSVPARAACRGCAVGAVEQDRRQRCFWLGADRAHGLVSRGGGQELGKSYAALTFGRPGAARLHAHHTVQPDPRSVKDVRSSSASGEGWNLRALGNQRCASGSPCEARHRVADGDLATSDARAPQVRSRNEQEFFHQPNLPA